MPETLTFETLTMERKAMCEKHGTFTQKRMLIGSARHAVWLMCPACEEDERLERERQNSAEQAAEFQRMLGRSCIPPLFLEKTLDNFIAETPEKQFVLQTVKNYVENFDTHLREGTGLIFLGGVGTGKSHLAAAIIQAILPKHIGVYVSISDYFRAIRETWRPNSRYTETQVLNRFVNAPLLVLDEIGKQYCTESEHNIIFDLIDGRYREKRPTVMMGNLKSNELEIYLGERSTDRLREVNKAIPFHWKSFREEMAEKRRAKDAASCTVSQ